MKTKEFEKTVTRVSNINKTLKQKGFDCEEIDKFWARMFRLQKKMKTEGLTLDDIKICTGCGHLNIEPMKPSAMACCPDSIYIPISK